MAKSASSTKTYEIQMSGVVVPKAHKHPLRLKASESSSRACDICEKGLKAHDYKYKCGDCDFDLCLPCFYKLSGTDPAGDIDGTMKLRAIVGDPEKRAELVAAARAVSIYQRKQLLALLILAVAVVVCLVALMARQAAQA
jgi:hypothetical protein